MKTAKYNKSEILKKAWSLVRKNGYTLSNAMRTAWAYARNVIVDASRGFIYKGSDERIFSSPVRKHGGLTALQSSLERGMAK